MWQEIVGHDEVVQRFRTILSGGRLATTYLFVGPSGIGKKLFAEKLAQVLLCPQVNLEPFLPCNVCQSCKLANAANHPDLHYVAQLPDKNELILSQFIGDKNHRGRAGLCYELALRPMVGRRKVAIVDDADRLNVESANSLLKTLEEPPPDSVIILIGTSQAHVLPTIRSRSQVIRFQSLDAEALSAKLGELAPAIDAETRQRLAQLADGSFERAIAMSDPEICRFQQEFHTLLGRLPLDRSAIAASLTKFVDGAGTESAQKRKRLAIGLELAIEFHRGALYQQLGVDNRDTENGDLSRSDAAADQRQIGITVGTLEHTLATLDKIGKYVNQGTLIQAWAWELGRPTPMC